MTPPRDNLDELLDRLRMATPPQPGSVTRDVWRRIADAEVVATRPGIFERIEAAFARPAFAVAFVAACVLCGLFVAETRISRLHAEQSAQVEENYLRLIDPLLATNAAQPQPVVLRR